MQFDLNSDWRFLYNIKEKVGRERIFGEADEFLKRPHKSEQS